ncbi:MAG TPA: cell division protein ZapA [Rhizomicrobium sp.]|jgi:cell division protein ZapA
MAQVDVTINGRAYAIACNAGEEERLRRLAEHVDAKVREILKTAGQPGEPRLLLMAALLVADEYFDSKTLLERRVQEIGDLTKARDDALARAADSARAAATAVETAANRVGEVAARVAGA